MHMVSHMHTPTSTQTLEQKYAGITLGELCPLFVMASLPCCSTTEGLDYLATFTDIQHIIFASVTTLVCSDISVRVPIKCDFTAHYEVQILGRDLYIVVCVSVSTVRVCVVRVGVWGCVCVAVVVAGVVVIAALLVQTHVLYVADVAAIVTVRTAHTGRHLGRRHQPRRTQPWWPCYTLFRIWKKTATNLIKTFL